MQDTPILDPSTAYALWAASYPPYAHNPLMQAEERTMLGRLPAALDDLAVLDAGCGSRPRSSVDRTWPRDRL
jgi:malonyl-CoA O-methyltransferase